MEYAIYKAEILNRRFEEYENIEEITVHDTEEEAEDEALKRLGELGKDECFVILEWDEVAERFGNLMIRIEQDGFPHLTDYNEDKWR